jgi:hypothetical protein
VVRQVSPQGLLPAPACRRATCLRACLPCSAQAGNAQAGGRQATTAGWSKVDSQINGEMSGRAGPRSLVFAKMSKSHWCEAGAVVSVISWKRLSWRGLQPQGEYKPIGTILAGTVLVESNPAMLNRVPRGSWPPLDWRGFAWCGLETAATVL